MLVYFSSIFITHCELREDHISVTCIIVSFVLDDVKMLFKESVKYVIFSHIKHKTVVEC